MYGAGLGGIDVDFGVVEVVLVEAVLGEVEVDLEEVKIVLGKGEADLREVATG